MHACVHIRTCAHMHEHFVYAKWRHLSCKQHESISPSPFSIWAGGENQTMKVKYVNYASPRVYIFYHPPKCTPMRVSHLYIHN